MGATFRAALATYRAEPRRVVGVAFVVVVPITLLQQVLLDIADHATDSGTILTMGLLSVVATAISALSTVLYAGALDLLVHAREHGELPPTIPEVARRLPLGRLFWASWLYFLAIVVGLLLFVIPAFAAVVLFGIVGPVIVMEDRRILSAFRRSAALTRRWFWRAVVLLLIPTIVEVEVAGAASILPGPPSLVAELIVEALVTGLVASYVGLVEVHTARTLVALDRAGRL